MARTYQDFTLAEKLLLYLLAFFAFLVLLMAFEDHKTFGASGLWDASMIWSDEGTITIAWDPSTTCPGGNTCGYDLELRHLEQTYIDGYYKFQGTQLTVNHKKSGHYEIFVRYWQSPDMKTFTYSDWASSSKNGEVVVGVPAPVLNKGWFLYWKIPTPSGGGIN